MERPVDVGREANATARESQRARLVVRAVTYAGAFVPGTDMKATIHIRNTGQSEAMNARIRRHAVMNATQPAGEMPAIAIPSEYSTTTLAAGDTMTSKIEINGITEAQWSAIESGTQRMFVYGVMTYESFGTPHRWTSASSPTPRS